MESRTFQVLEFPKILGALSGLAVSEPGASACLAIRPLTSFDAVRRENDLFDQARAWIRESGFTLTAFPDIDAIFPHLGRETAVLDQDALFALRIALDLARTARESLKGYEERGWDVLNQALTASDWPQKTVSGITRCLDGEGMIRDESSPDLQAVRREIRTIHQRCTKRVKDFILQENLGQAMQDEYMTISSDRYVLPIKSNFKNKAKGIIHDYSQTGETCYFEPIFLVETNNRLQELKREERQEEYKVLQYLTGLVREEAEEVLRAYRGVVSIDVLMAKIRLADKYDGRTIEVVREGAPNLIKARHPLLALADDSVQPMDIELMDGQKAMIVSGGNAGGKTVCLKTVGLIGLMAFSGLPVPAKEGQPPAHVARRVRDHGRRAVPGGERPPPLPRRFNTCAACGAKWTTTHCSSWMNSARAPTRPRARPWPRRSSTPWWRRAPPRSRPPISRRSRPMPWAPSPCGPPACCSTRAPSVRSSSSPTTRWARPSPWMWPRSTDCLTKFSPVPKSIYCWTVPTPPPCWTGSMKWP